MGLRDRSMNDIKGEGRADCPQSAGACHETVPTMELPTDLAHRLSRLHPSARFLEDQEPYLHSRTSIRHFVSI
jgi:hypothetical protein